MSRIVIGHTMSRPRLYKSTVMVGLTVATLVVLVNFPGRVIEWQPHSITSFEHGWPLVYMRRRTVEPHPQYFDPIVYSFRRDAISALPRWGVPWMNIDNWKIWEAGEYDDDAWWQFGAPMFVADVLASTALLIAIVAGSEFRRRRRQSILTFNLGDMFVAVTVISLAIGWLVHAKRDYRRELPLAEKGWSDAECGFGIQDEMCVAPTWIRSLLGDHLMPDLTWRVASVSVYWDEVQDANKLCEELAEFSHLRVISIDGYWEEGIRVPFSALSSLRNLNRIEIDNSQYAFDERDIRELAKLKGLNEIAFRSVDEIPSELHAQLQAALPECRISDVYDVW